MATFTVHDRTALTGANSASDDEFLIWDLSASTHKKISRAELLVGLAAQGAIVKVGVEVIHTASGPILRLTDTPSNQQGGMNVNSTVSGYLYVGTYTVNGMSFGTANAERVRIGAAGTVHFQSVGTTASAANAFLDSGSSPANQLLRSTSSLAYKRDVENLDSGIADAVIDRARPVFYRSKAEADRPDWSFLGFIAEEMAEIEPRLVLYGYRDQHYDDIEIPAAGDQPARTERRLKPDAVKVPDGVAYERLTVVLVDVVRRERAKVAALEAAVAALSARVEALESA